jgi:hypothetical protein
MRGGYANLVEAFKLSDKDVDKFTGVEKSNMTTFMNLSNSMKNMDYAGAKQYLDILKYNADQYPKVVASLNPADKDEFFRLSPNSKTYAETYDKMVADYNYALATKPAMILLKSDSTSAPAPGPSVRAPAPAPGPSVRASAPAPGPSVRASAPAPGPTPGSTSGSIFGSIFGSTSGPTSGPTSSFDPIRHKSFAEDYKIDVAKFAIAAQNMPPSTAADYAKFIGTNGYK